MRYASKFSPDERARSTFWGPWPVAAPVLQGKGTFDIIPANPRLTRLAGPFAQYES